MCRALPQRPGTGGGQFPGGRHRRPAGGMRHQRHRRAGRKRGPGGNRHGPAHPARFLRRPDDRDQAEEIAKTSRLLVSPDRHGACSANKAVVGAERLRRIRRASTRTACSKNRTTYEIMNPARRRLEEYQLLLTKHFRPATPSASRLKQLGIFPVRRRNWTSSSSSFKALADRKKEIFDDDLEALLEEEVKSAPGVVPMDYLQFSSGTTVVPTATVAFETKEASRRRPLAATAPWTPPQGDRQNYRF